MFPGVYKGVRVRVWKAPISHSVSYLELRRAYSKYCIAHPNICAVLGVCIQVRVSRSCIRLKCVCVVCVEAEESE
jgi:hypothetical protein